MTENAWWRTRPLDDAPTAAEWAGYVRSLVRTPPRRPVSRYHSAFRMLLGTPPFARASWGTGTGPVTVVYSGPTLRRPHRTSR